MLLVGLTGSIGMGKTTTASMFKTYGYGVYNADDAVHYIYENDQKIIDQINDKFPGSKVDNKIDRGVLRHILTKDPKKFKDLENIAKTKGFLLVSSSPLTRSSYHADEDFRKLQDARNKRLECHQLQ